MAETFSRAETGVARITAADGKTYKIVGVRAVTPEETIHVEIQPTTQVTSRYEQSRNPNTTRRTRRGNVLTRAVGSIAGFALASSLAVGIGEFAGSTVKNGLPDGVTETLEYIVPDALIGDK